MLAEFQRRFTATLNTVNQGAFMAAFAKTYFTGALDAEVHRISAGTLASFFGADGANNANRMLEGDVLCVYYDALVMRSGGGRRQSLAEAPENNASLTPASLFLLRAHPERVANALPIATVANGELVFPNGSVFAAGTPGRFEGRAGTHAHYAGAAVRIGGGNTGDTLRAALEGAAGTGGRDGVLILYRDGATPLRLDFDALTALIGGADANAYHTHAVLLQRWTNAAAMDAAAAANLDVWSPRFATAYANQVVALDFNVNVRLTANSAVTWAVLLDGVQVDTGTTDVLDATNNPDVPDIPLNGSSWFTVPQRGTAHTLILRLTAASSAISVRPGSRAVLS